MVNKITDAAAEEFKNEIQRILKLIRAYHEAEDWATLNASDVADKTAYIQNAKKMENYYQQIMDFRENYFVEYAVDKRGGPRVPKLITELNNYPEKYQTAISSGLAAFDREFKKMTEDKTTKPWQQANFVELIKAAEEEELAKINQEAEELRQISWHAFSQMQESDFRNTKGLSDIERASKAYLKLSETFNQISYFVAEKILAGETIEERSRLLEHYIAVMKKSVELNDLSTASAINAALKHNVIRSLPTTNKILSQQAKEVAKAVNQLTSNPQNFYHAMLHSEKPIIPFYGAFRTMLEFSHGNKDKFDKIVHQLTHLQEQYKDAYGLPDIATFSENQKKLLNDKTDIDDLREKAEMIKEREMNSSQPLVTSSLIKDKVIQLDNGIKTYLKDKELKQSKKDRIESDILDATNHMEHVMRDIQFYTSKIKSRDSLDQERKTALKFILDHIKTDEGMNKLGNVSRLTQEALQKRIDYIDKELNNPDSILRKHHKFSTKSTEFTSAHAYLKDLKAATEDLLKHQTSMDELEKSDLAQQAVQASTATQTAAPNEEKPKADESKAPAIEIKAAPAKPIIEYDHQPTKVELSQKLPRNLAAYAKVGEKEGGANAPGALGGRYQISYDIKHPDGTQETTSQTILFKQDIQGGVIRHDKNIAEFVAGEIMNELIGDSAAAIILATTPGHENKIPDETGENIYIGSVYFDGYKDLFVELYERQDKEVPKDRPKGVGILPGRTEILKSGMLDQALGKCPYNDFEKVNIASAITGDFDVHWANYGVSTEPDGTPCEYLKVTEAPRKDHLTELGLSQNAAYVRDGDNQLFYVNQSRNECVRIKKGITPDFLNEFDSLMAKNPHQLTSENLKWIKQKTGHIHGSKRLVKIDHGGALDNLSNDLNIHSHLKHTPITFEQGKITTRPTNHFREYPRGLKVSKEFADQLDKMANHDPVIMRKRIENTINTVANFYGPKPLVDFAKRIGLKLDKKFLRQDWENTSPEVKNQLKNELVEKLKAYLIYKIDRRMQSAKQLSTDIKMSLAIKNVNGQFEFDKSQFDIANVIKENPHYFLKSDFHFRKKDQRSGFGPIKTKLFKKAKLKKLVNKEVDNQLSTLISLSKEKADPSIIEHILANKRLLKQLEKKPGALAELKETYQTILNHQSVDLFEMSRQVFLATGPNKLDESYRLTHSQLLSDHVIKDILAEKSLSHRALILERWIALMGKAYLNNDFHTAIAIYQGIHDPNIAKLGRTFSSLSENAKQTKEQFESLFADEITKQLDPDKISELMTTKISEPGPMIPAYTGNADQHILMEEPKKRALFSQQPPQNPGPLQMRIKDNENAPKTDALVNAFAAETLEPKMKRQKPSALLKDKKLFNFVTAKPIFKGERWLEKEAEYKLYPDRLKKSTNPYIQESASNHFTLGNEEPNRSKQLLQLKHDLIERDTLVNGEKLGHAETEEELVNLLKEKFPHKYELLIQYYSQKPSYLVMGVLHSTSTIAYIKQSEASPAIKNIYQGRDGEIYFQTTAKQFTKIDNDRKLLGIVPGSIESLYKLTDKGFELVHIKSDNREMSDCIMGKIDAGDISETPQKPIRNYNQLYQTISQMQPGVNPSEEFNLAIKDPSNMIGEVHNRIKDLQMRGLMLYTPDSSKPYEQYYVKLQKTSDDLNPIHPNEASIQALRYLRGMLLIAENMPAAKQQPLISAIMEAFNKNKASFSTDLLASHVNDLGEKFAGILVTTFGINPDHASKQVTMARDLGVLLETHPSICTITENTETNRVTIEQSITAKISKSFYREEMFDCADKPWFINAKKFAGFDKDADNTWLENFFSHYALQLQQNGIPAPSSARWLPLPANNQEIKTTVAEKNPDGTLKVMNESSFIRMGINSSYDIKGKELQDTLGVKQIKEILKGRLESRIEEFKELYKGHIDENDFDFFVSYQTLLSPIKAEIHGFHKDNNAKFARRAHEAMQELAEEYNQLSRAKTNGANVHFCHTNAPVNKLASLILPIMPKKISMKISRHLSVINKSFNNKQVRNFKVEKTKELIEQILKTKLDFSPDKQSDIEALAKQLQNGELKDIKQELQHELASRLRAAFYLKQLLDKNPPFYQMQKFQSNIMIAALELLALGEQVISLDGCKSARDRTATFAAAVKTMQENPEAMHNWEALNKGIIASLKEGHHFRSMLYHSAIVKIGAVHSYFMNQLPLKIQSGIDSLKAFSKRLGGKATGKDYVITRKALKKTTNPCIIKSDIAHDFTYSGAKRGFAEQTLIRLGISSNTKLNGKELSQKDLNALDHPTFEAMLEKEFPGKAKQLIQHYCQEPSYLVPLALKPENYANATTIIKQPDARLIQKELFRGKDGEVYYSATINEFKLVNSRNNALEGTIKGPIQSLFKLTDKGFKLIFIKSPNKELSQCLMGQIKYSELTLGDKVKSREKAAVAVAKTTSLPHEVQASPSFLSNHEKTLEHAKKLSTWKRLLGLKPKAVTLENEGDSDSESKKPRSH